MKFLKRFTQHNFEVKHIIILFVVLVTFQVAISYLHKVSMSNLITQTMDLYKKDSAERLANLTATSLELLLEQSLFDQEKSLEKRREIIQAFNIILNQQTLQQNVDELCLIFTSEGKTFAIDEGIWLYNFIFSHEIPEGPDKLFYNEAIYRYQQIAREIEDTEQIFCNWDNIQSFHVLVPLVLKGEYEGVVYMKITPDVSNITQEISTVYDETGIIFTALILFGLLAMFYLTSYTVKERDLAQELLFREREQQIKKDIAHQKEALFTKRIYHAYHKAEKVMGFIKDELRVLTDKNIDKFKYIVTRYSSFISRVIYDMKWYEPPVHTIRNQLFNTDINKVIEFLVEYLFKRVYSEHTAYVFELKLDRQLPKVHINEYVIWEILEPLIQNSIDHNKGKNITITIRTEYHESENYSEIAIMDNGEGISPELLNRNEEGIKNIFLEHTSTSANTKNSGYGCYIAYELSTKRCGCMLDAVNLKSSGCALIIKIPINN